MKTAIIRYYAIPFQRIAVFTLFMVLLSPNIGLALIDGGDVDGRSLKGPDLLVVAHQRASRAPLPSSGTYYGVALGDLDHDGKMDIVAAGENGVECWAGDGTGSWTDKTNPANTGKYYDVALADVNHDGDLDILAASDSGVSLWTGNAAWAWSVGTAPLGSGKYLTIENGDINNDGDQDLVAGGVNGIQVRLGNGAGGWTNAPDPTSTDTFYDVALKDVDNDGKLDIVAAGNDSAASNGTVMVFMGNGTGAWPSTVTVASAVPGPFKAVASSDVNRDGKPDIVAARNGIIQYWTGNGANVWTPGTAPSATPNNGALVVSDLNNDGRLDIASGNENGTMAWLGNGGTAWPSTPALPIVNVSVLCLVAGDLNHDARPDLVAATKGKGLVQWLSDVPAVQVTGWTNASTGLQATGKWADIDFGDVNNDGNLDLVITSYQSQNQGLRFFLGNGAGTWTASSTGLNSSNSYSGARLVDLDHNGKLDLVASCDAGTGGTIGIQVWKGNGDGTWAYNNTIDPRSGAGLEVGDFNNDGNMDVATGFWGGGWGPVIYLGNGNLTFQADSGPTSTFNVDDVAVGDVDNDGKQDFAASAMNTAGVQVWAGDGTGGPTSWTREDSGLPTTAVYLGLAMADVDDDGDLDLATGGYGPGSGLHAYLGNGGAGGAMSWTEASIGLPQGTNKYSGIEFADLNLDGNVDLLASNVTVGGGGVELFAGNGKSGGTMSWTEIGAAPLPSSGIVWGVRYGDINRDGALDIAATPDGSGVIVWTTNVAAPTYFDHVTMAPATGNIEVGQRQEFLAQAYDASNNPVSGITYAWQVEGGIGALDKVTGTHVNLTGAIVGAGNLKVTAMKGLFAKGNASDISVSAPPSPLDVNVIPEMSIAPDTIWVKGTNVTGDQENASLRIGLKAMGRNITLGDALVVNLTLAQDITIVPGTVSLSANSTVQNVNGTTSLSWNISSIGNGTTINITLDIVSGKNGTSVPLTVPDISDIRFMNMSGRQVVKLDALSLKVLAIERTMPGPPTGLRAVAGNGFVQLAWEPPSFDGNSSLTGYNIQRGTTDGGETFLKAIGNITSYNDTNVTNGLKYHFKVTAVNSVGEGPRSVGVNATPQDPTLLPGPPRGLKATPSDGIVSLEWSPPLTDGSSKVLTYIIYRATTAGGGTFFVEVTNLTFNDTSVTNNVTYFYSVSAKNAIGEGPRTPEVDAMPKGGLPPLKDVPTGPLGLNAMAGDGRINIGWEPPLSDGGSPVLGYRIMRREGASKMALLKALGPVLGYNDTDVINGVTYYYSLAAFNDIGQGPMTSEVNATPWSLPSEPKAFNVKVIEKGKVQCSWDIPEDDGGYAITGYKVYRSDVGAKGPYSDLGLMTNRSFLDVNTKPGTTYWYMVSAFTAKGDGTASVPISVTIPSEKGPSGGTSGQGILPYILLIIVIAIVVAIVLVLMKRKKGRTLPVEAPRTEQAYLDPKLGYPEKPEGTPPPAPQPPPQS